MEEGRTRDLCEEGKGGNKKQEKEFVNSRRKERKEGRKEGEKQMESRQK